MDQGALHHFSPEKRGSMFSQSGAVSRILLIIAVIVFVAIIAVVGVLKLNDLRSPKASEVSESQNPPEPPAPVYETTLGNIRIFLISAENLGDRLPGTGRQKDMVTTEKFIRVTIGAQNKGKTTSKSGAWALGNIVDAERRTFSAVAPRVSNIIPKSSRCGAAMKPEFEPVICTKLYAVSRISDQLAVRVKVGKKGEYLDLDIK